MNSAGHGPVHPPRFSNRPNRPIRQDSGEVIWHSRSVAVVAHLLVKVGGAAHVLLGQRGPLCPDYVGYWTLPCGYLDWDESAPDAVRREVWEETGFDVSGVVAAAGGLQQPWHVFSDPRHDARQNVVLHYGVVFEAAELPQLTTAHAEPGECVAVRWWRVSEALEAELAFGHQHDLRRYLQHLGQHLGER